MPDGLTFNLRASGLPRDSLTTPWRPAPNHFLQPQAAQLGIIIDGDSDKLAAFTPEETPVARRPRLGPRLAMRSHPIHPSACGCRGVQHQLQ